MAATAAGQESSGVYDADYIEWRIAADQAEYEAARLEQLRAQADACFERLEADYIEWRITRDEAEYEAAWLAEAQEAAERRHCQAARNRAATQHPSRHARSRERRCRPSRRTRVAASSPDGPEPPPPPQGRAPVDGGHRRLVPGRDRVRARVVRAADPALRRQRDVGLEAVVA